MRILSIGVKELNLYRIKQHHPYKNAYLNKPGPGVLWGSTLIKLPNGTIDSSWNYFVTNDYFDKSFKYGVSFTLNKNAKIMEIDSIETYLDYMEKYRVALGRLHELAENDDDIESYSLDFAKIEEAFDAFHLTEDAFLQLRMFSFSSRSTLKYRDFYSYDAESWIIFNPDCINRGSILNHNNILNGRIAMDKK